MPHVTIVGAGLAGTILAIILARRGYSVEIWEKNSEAETINRNSERAYNLTIYEYATGLLKEWGLWEEVKGVMIPIMGSDNRIGGDIVTTLPEVEYFTFQRADLLDKLIQIAKNIPQIDIYFGRQMVDIDRKKKILFFVKSNYKLEQRGYRTLIGTDGINSIVRQHVQQGQESSHTVTNSGWVYQKINLKNETVKALNWDNKLIHTWTSSKAILTALPNLDNNFSIMLLTPDDRRDQIRESLGQNFTDLRPALQEIDQSIKNNPVGKLMTSRTLPWYWEDSLAILGDAAHGFLPFSGQGVSAALADIDTIDNLLGKHKNDWGKVFYEFQTIRKRQAEAVADLSIESMGRYNRNDRINTDTVMEKWESLMHKYLPAFFQPPVHILVDKNPNLAFEYMQKHAWQKKIFLAMGGAIISAAASLIYKMITRTVKLQSAVNLPPVWRDTNQREPRLGQRHQKPIKLTPVKQEKWQT